MGKCGSPDRIISPLHKDRFDNRGWNPVVIITMENGIDPGKLTAGVWVA